MLVCGVRKSCRSVAASCAASRIVRDLAVVVWAVALCASLAPAGAQAPGAPPGVPEGELPLVVFFGSSSCETCEQLKKTVVYPVQRRYEGKVKWVFYDITDPESLEALLFFEEQYADDSQTSTKVYAGSRVLSGEEDIRANLESVVAALARQGAQAPRELAPPEAPAEFDPEKAKRQRLMRFALGKVILAGLSDGVNPCAFATLVFFISVLSCLRKSKREILLVGAAYTVAVFVTYLGLGIGALAALRTVSVAWGVARGISVGAGVLALVLGVVSLVDLVNYLRRRDSKEMHLVLPPKLRAFMNHHIHMRLRSSRGLLGTSLLLGVTVSLLESVCTGQIYLPIIVDLLDDPVVAGRARAYLVLYNLMFILPLVVIFGVAMAGVSSKRMSDFLVKHLGWLKAAVAAVLLTIGLSLVLNPANSGAHDDESEPNSPDVPAAGQSGTGD